MFLALCRFFEFEFFIEILTTFSVFYINVCDKKLGNFYKKLKTFWHFVTYFASEVYFEHGLDLATHRDMDKTKSFPKPRISAFMTSKITFLTRFHTIIAACLFWAWNLGCATTLCISRYSVGRKITESAPVLLLKEGVERPDTYADKRSCSSVCANSFSASRNVYSSSGMRTTDVRSSSLPRNFPSSRTWWVTLQCYS